MSLFGNKTNASTQTIASGVTIQTSIYGSVVPVLYGQTRQTGNLIWYGGFQAIPPNSGGSGGGKGGGGSGGKNGSSSNSTDYKASFAFALAEGTLGGVSNVWSSKSETAFSASNLSFADGDLAQSPWGYLTTNFAGQDLAYAGTGYVYAAAYDLGDSAELPNLSYEVTGLFANAISGLPDADPRDIVVDVLTNGRYGIGFPSARLGDLSVFSNYCRAAGLVVSPLFDTQQDAATQVNQIVQDCNAEFVWSGASLTIVPYGDADLSANSATYTAPAAALYSLTDDDFLDNGSSDPVQCSRARPSDRMNSVKLEWLNRSNQYNIEVVEAADQAAIETYGLRTDQPSQSHWFCDLGAATMSATLQLQRQAVRNQYSFTLGWRYCLLDPMDIIEITDSGLGLSQQWCRIVSIAEDDTGNLAIVAEDYLHGAGSAPLYSYQSGSPFIANYNVTPGSANAPLIFEPPPAMLAANSIAAPQILVGASGGANWGGCDVWLSLDGSTYQRMGRIGSRARQGILHANLASGSDPDTTDTLSVDLSESGGALLSGTLSDANAFRTLCYVDGELIAYETATLTGATLYGLATLRRGVYGSAIAAHAAGTEFCRLDDNILWIDLPVTPVSYVGQTLYLKLLSFNLYGGAQETLASVSAYSYVPGGAGEFVYPPSAVSFTVGAEQQKDGTWISFGVVAWTASSDPFFDQYEVQYRLHTGPGPWIGFSCGPNTTSFQISPLPANTAYDVQVRAVRSSGPFYSSWSQDLNVATVGKTSLPPPPTSLNVSGGYRQIAVSWAPVTSENDIAFYTVLIGVSNVQSAATIGAQVNANSAIVPGLALATEYWVWVKSTDTSGNVSATALGPGSATTLGVEAADITGQIVNSQIAANAIAASNLIDGLNVVQAVATIADANPATSIIAYAADSGLLYQWNGSAWVGTTAEIEPGSITLASFSTSLTPVQIVSSLPGTATEGEVAVLTTDGQLYRYHSGAWTPAVPAANVTGQLTASQIESLTAAQLTGQITTTQIENDAISTALLQAGAVQTANLAAGAVTAETIAANTITATQIASETITGALIAAGTITASNIESDTITAGQLAAGSVTAAQLAAGAVTASKLFVGNTTSLVIDPYTADHSYWTLAGGAYYESSTTLLGQMGVTGAVSINLSTISSGETGDFGVQTAGFLSVQPATQYSFSCLAYADGAPNKTLFIYAQWFDRTGTYISSVAAASATNTTPWNVTGGAPLRGTLTSPSNAAYCQPFWLVFGTSPDSSAGTGLWCISNFSFQAMTPGTLIENGAITTNLIAANAVTASQIAAGTITAAQIEAAGITGTNIAGATITGANIAATTITGTNIVGGTITGDKITGNFFQGYNFIATSGGSGALQLVGAQTTVSGLTYGPYMACVDPSGVTRVILGHWAGADGLWIYDASGDVIFEEAQLGSGVVETVNLADNSVTYPYSATLSDVAIGNSGYTTLWSQVSPATGVVQIIAVFNVANSYTGTAYTLDWQITIGGTVVYDSGDTDYNPWTITQILSVSSGQSIAIQVKIIASGSAATDVVYANLSALVIQR